MATFAVNILQITIEPHPNADSLELAVVGDYRSIVPINTYKTGDYVAYIPEAAIVPEWLIEQLGLVGRLAGKQRNRVKAVKLRGIVSQGLVTKCDYHPDVDAWSIHNDDVDEWHFVKEGVDVADFLGIVKWEPPIPIHMAGEVQNSHGLTVKYDIENIKRHPNVLQDGEQVVVSEKLHGTWACLGMHRECGLVVTSKGLSGQGVSFIDNGANADNLYMRTAKNLKVGSELAVVAAYNSLLVDGADGVYLLGEIYGGNVQDLKYGLKTPEFRLFDCYVGTPGIGRYLNYDELVDLANHLSIKMCPVLYVGPYDKGIVLDLTNGTETVSGTSANIREGVVVRTTTERRDATIGRVQLKSVSDAYLLRGGKTTEYT